MRFYTQLIFLITLFTHCFTTTAFAQEAEIAGQINVYTAVEGIDYCENTLIVPDASSFAEGDFAILIQMKGADIFSKTQGDSTEFFGTITNVNNAGIYEKCQIKSIDGSRILIENTLLNTYAIESQVQLVSMPSFENARVVETLQAQNWDGRTGGIIALQVSNTLTLDAPIRADGAGFRGGQTFSASDNNCIGGLNNSLAFAYADDDWRGAAKGEGIAAIIENKEFGRGPQANGGGGGNDHNSGGGGGAHATLGGNGGRRLTPLFDFNLRCKGDNPGLSGKRLEALEDRLFFGGGGGAGHTNNTSDDVGGGDGGGIVILEIGTLVGNEQTISANGAIAVNVEGDGAGGGGAGGSIALLVENISSPVNIEVLGGNGGTVDNAGADACMGPGGGGSGGRFLTNANANQPLTFNLEGGTAGRSTRSADEDCVNGTNDAEDGASGQLDPLTNLVESNTPAGRPEIITQPEIFNACIGASATIGVEVAGALANYQWQIDRADGNGFVNIAANTNFSDITTNTLTIINVDNNLNNNRFRLLISSECFEEISSDPIILSISADAVVPDFDFELQPGGVVLFTNTSAFANSVVWDFGGGVVSNMENTSFTYAEEGFYEVTLTATNECGSQTITQTVQVVFEPTAGFTARNLEGCAPFDITFENLSSENASTFEWLFPGGQPGNSTERNPTVTYREAGNYQVGLVAFNEAGSDTLIRMGFVNIAARPDPNFIEESQNDDLTIELTNTTVGGEEFFWDFGDGSPNTSEVNPMHTYDEPGVYTVTLVAINECGESSRRVDIAVGSAPLALFSSSTNMGCFPITIQFFNQSTGLIDDLIWQFPGGQPSESTEENPRITYNAPGRYSVSLGVRNELGLDQLEKDSFITILPSPSPNFNFTAVDGAVDFTNLSTNADRYIWVFGDGATSQEVEPTHEYQQTGLYFTTLNAYNDGCSASVTAPVNIIISSIDVLGKTVKIVSYPNPTNDLLNVSVEGLPRQDINLRLFSSNGQVLSEQLSNSSETTILNLVDFPSGLYYLQVVGIDFEVNQKIFKE
ncbi:MAG: PKD domain-containing protein [Bacteroidota bacterium]